MIFQSSLAARLNFLLTLCIGGMVLVTSGVDYQLSRRVILDQVAGETETVIGDTLADLETHISGIERSTQLFASILVQRSYSEEELVQMLLVVVRGRSDIFGTTVALAPRSGDSGRGFAPYYHHGADGELLAARVGRSRTRRRLPGAARSDRLLPRRRAAQARAGARSCSALPLPAASRNPRTGKGA